MATPFFQAFYIYEITSNRFLLNTYDIIGAAIAQIYE